MNMTIPNKKNKPFNLTTKNNLRILSWNIQAPSTTEGNKFDVKPFQEILNNHDFACLQEIRRDVHLVGYRSVCNTRRDNKSGGVGILIKNELVEGTEIVKSLDHSDYLICKLRKEFFKLDEDVFLVNVYIKPHNSSASSTNDNGKDTIKRM